MNIDDSNMAAQAICHAAHMAGTAWQEAGFAASAPSVLFRPRIFIDGNQWCALYGENLQEGVAGFGDSPAEAIFDFDKAWATKLKEKP